MWTSRTLHNRQIRIMSPCQFKVLSLVGMSSRRRNAKATNRQGGGTRDNGDSQTNLCNSRGAVLGVYHKSPLRNHYELKPQIPRVCNWVPTVAGFENVHTFWHAEVRLPCSSSLVHWRSRVRVGQPTGQEASSNLTLDWNRDE